MEEIKQNQKNPEQKPLNNKITKIVIIFFILIILLFGIKSYYNNGCRGYRPYWYNPFYCTETQDWYRSSQDPNTGMGFKPTDNLMQTKGDANTGIEVIVNFEKDKSQTTRMFRIGFSTHVVDYSGYNFNENVVLRDSQNKEYKALNITTEGAGHHQAIEASFPFVSAPFKLVVKNLAGVDERVFNW